MMADLMTCQRSKDGVLSSAHLPDNPIGQDNAVFAVDDQQGIRDDCLLKPGTITGSQHALHLYTLQNRHKSLDRDTLMQKLHEQGIGSGIHYISIADHPYYQDNYGWQPDDFPRARHYGENTFSIPLAPSLTDDQVDRIINTINRILD